MKKIYFVCALAAMMSAGCATQGTRSVPDVRDTDPMIVQLSSSARMAFDKGEVSTATAMYRRALDRARAIDNSREIGRNAHNLAACLIQLEDWDEALKLLAEAERETIRAGGDAGPILLLAAETARLRGDDEKAGALLDRLEQLEISSEMRGQAYVLRAHLACDRKDGPRAAAHLTRANGYLKQVESPGLAGSIAAVSGRVAEMNSQWAEAAAAFDREAAWMKTADRLPEMARALERAGQNYLKAEQLNKAADSFFRSARSWMAQGNYIDALRVIEQAASLKPEDEASQETMAVIAELFEEIRRSVEQQQGQVAKP